MIFFKNYQANRWHTGSFLHGLVNITLYLFLPICAMFLRQKTQFYSMETFDNDNINIKLASPSIYVLVNELIIFNKLRLVIISIFANKNTLMCTCHCLLYKTILFLFYFFLKLHLIIQKKICLCFHTKV